MYGKFPGVSAADTSVNQLRFSELENQVASVDGKITRLDAKIAGITPDMFNFSGKCVAWFWYATLP